MTKKKITSILQGIELFKNCTEEELNRISEIVLKKEVNKREIIFAEEDNCNVVYFIAKGQVKIYRTTADGKEQIVNLLSETDMFPHVGLFGGSKYPATAKAMEKTSLYYLLVDDFNNLLIESPGLAIKLLQIMDNKIRHLQKRLSHVMIGDVTDKIVKTLLNLGKTNGIKRESGYEILIDVTHQDIADMLGTTRETVSRVISQLKKEGRIEYTGNSIILKDE